MTIRLYYTDPYLLEFDAVVTSTERVEGRHAVVLDRTAFYPTSGGQPFDTGVLNGVRVTDVVELEDGRIAHAIDGDLAIGGRVHGIVDGARRFDHMQQHSGQHVLSAAFDRVCRAGTVSFHLGADASTIDLDRELSPTEIQAAEDRANQVVWEDRPVTIRFAEADEAAALPLRKPSRRTGTLRVIEIQDFDVSACGGTHVSRTGAIGIIAVLADERFRGGSRISFVCGGRALRSLRALRDAVSGSLRHLSVPPAELPAAIERAQADNKTLRREIRGLLEKLAPYQAAELVAGAQEVGGVKIVVRALDGHDATSLKSVATAAAARPRVAAALFTAVPPYLVAVARSTDVAVDAGAVVRALTARFGGRGGGRPDLAQGGGLNGTLQQMLDTASTLLGGAPEAQARSPRP